MSVPAMNAIMVESVDGQKYPIDFNDGVDIVTVKTKQNEFQIDIKEFLYGFKLTKKKILLACKLACEFAEIAGEFSIQDLLDEDERRGYGVFKYLYENNQEKIERWVKRNFGRNLLRSTDIRTGTDDWLPAFRNSDHGRGMYATEVSRIIETDEEKYLEFVPAEEKRASTKTKSQSTKSSLRYEGSNVPVSREDFSVEDSTIGVIEGLAREVRHTLKRIIDFEAQVPQKDLPVNTARMNKAAHALLKEVELVEEDIESYGKARSAN